MGRRAGFVLLFYILLLDRNQNLFWLPETPSKGTFQAYQIVHSYSIYSIRLVEYNVNCSLGIYTLSHLSSWSKLPPDVRSLIDRIRRDGQ